MNNQDIIALIKTQKQGKAFNRLYKYFPVVKKMILARGGSKQDAEDIFQEGLIVFCRKAEAPSFKLTSSLDTYLYSICRFLWNDELKKRNKLPVEDLQDDSDKITGENLTAIIENEKQYQNAERALKQLGEKCIELLQLFYVKMLSMKEISQKLGFSSEKITKNQKYKCLERARTYYKTHE